MWRWMFEEVCEYICVSVWENAIYMYLRHTTNLHDREKKANNFEFVLCVDIHTTHMVAIL